MARFECGDRLTTALRHRVHSVLRIDWHSAVISATRPTWQQ